MKQRVRWLSVTRVLGLFLVLIYHFFHDVLPGGFLGVDVFFTLSGYLITSLIVEEYRKHGRFRLFRFFRKRFLRIFPPLLFSVALTLPFALLISPDFTVGILRQIAAALGFVTNYFEILTGGSYEAQLLPHLYIHTWSLSVEMHFYLIWGLVCALAALLFSPCSPRTRTRLFRASLFTISAGAAALSYLFMRRSYIAESAETAFDSAYFGSLSHAFPFLIGAAAAALFGAWAPQIAREERPAAIGTAILCMVSAAFGIVYTARMLSFSDEAVYQYGFAAASLMTVVLLLGARTLHAALPKPIREPRPLGVLADLSYDMYLFHWPLYIIFSSVTANNALASLIAFALSLLFSAVLYGCVEPFFHIREDRAKTARPQTADRMPAVLHAALLLILPAAFGLSAFVVQKAPVITGIERDIGVGYILSDGDYLSGLRNRIGLIDDRPVLSDKPLTRGIRIAQTTPIWQSPAVPLPDIEPVVVSGGVTVIGDSVCLGAQSVLNRMIADCQVDAKVSRSVKAGLDVMTSLQSNDRLREYVVIAMGTNGTYGYEDLLTRFITELEPGHKLIFITPFDGRANKNAGIVNETAAWERTLPLTYDYVTVADWNSLIAPQADLLASDKVHMGGQASMILYARCIADAIAVASLGGTK